MMHHSCSGLRIKGIPLRICVAVFINLAVYGMAAAFLFSFLPRLIKYMEVSEINAGYWTGIIASIVYVGRFITFFAWGCLSDRLGRKTGFVLAGLTLYASSLGFGFCHTIWTTAFVRLLQGMSMGHKVLGKAIMADYCDQENISFGISIVMAATDIGVMMGPCVSGLLVFPARKFPSVFSHSQLFNKYIMLLPSLVLVAGCVVSVLLTCTLIPNDSPRKINQDSIELSGIGSFLKASKLIKIKSLMLSCLLYIVFSFVAIGVEEVIPLFAATAVKYKGMGLTEARIGILLLVVSVIATIYQLTWLPFIINCFGAKKAFMGSGFLLALFHPLLPALAVLNNDTAINVLFVIVCSVIRCAMATGFVTVNVFVYNSVEHHLVGSANGLAMMFAQLGAILAPSVYGSLFAWSLGNVKVEENLQNLGFPFNQYLVFLFSFFIMLCTCWCAFMLPESINSKIVEKSAAESEEKGLLFDETATDDE